MSGAVEEKAPQGGKDYRVTLPSLGKDERDHKGEEEEECKYRET